MNNNDNSEFKMRILIFFEFIVLALVNEYLIINYSDNPLLLVICCFISSGILSYSYLQYRFMKKTKNYTEEILNCIELINRDNYDSVKAAGSVVLQPVYDRFAEIHKITKETEENRQKILSIVNSVAVNIEIESLLEDLLPKLIEVTKSNCGAFYLANLSTNKLEIKKSIGFSKNVYQEFDISLGEGFIGAPALHKEIKIVIDMPDDTIYIIRTFLGKVKPKSMMVVPIVNQEQLVGVFAFASIFEYSQSQLEMVELIKYYVGAAVGNGMTYEKTKRLTNELKFQNRLIQNLNDDLEKKVQDRTQFLDEIIDSIKDYAIFAMDKDFNIILWNKGAEMLFGYTLQDTMGKNVENIYPSDEVKAGYLKKRLETVQKEGRLTETGWRFRKDGSSYYAETVLFTRYDSQGEVKSITNITKDITALKNLESQLWFEKEFSQSLIETSNSAMVFTDEEMYIQTVNKMAIELVGEELFAGHLFYEYFEDSNRFKEEIENIVETSINCAMKFKLKDSDIVLNMNVSVLINEVDYSRILFFYLSKHVD